MKKKNKKIEELEEVLALPVEQRAAAIDALRKKQPKAKQALNDLTALEHLGYSNTPQAKTLRQIVIDEYRTILSNPKDIDGKGTSLGEILRNRMGFDPIASIELLVKLENMQSPMQKMLHTILTRYYAPMAGDE